MNKLLYIVGMAFLLSTTANGQQNATDSLVAIGYNDADTKVIDLGFVKKDRGNLTQAVSTVSSEVLANKTATSLQNSLYGLLPGLYAKQNVGWHSEATLNIRGQGGLGEGTPLIIVDGFPRSLNTITLEEVESVSVLKDGAATALYGARGANGVILVNTKRGTYNFLM